jgi:hypothetical protein
MEIIKNKQGNNELGKENMNDTNKEDEEEIYNLIKSSALLKGLEYNERIIEPIGNWTYPEKYNKLSKTQIDEIRKTYKIDIDGEDIPPSINNFKNMKLPKSIIHGLLKKKIDYPTPIQMQGLPVV